MSIKRAIISTNVFSDPPETLWSAFSLISCKRISVIPPAIRSLIWSSSIHWSCVTISLEGNTNFHNLWASLLFDINSLHIFFTPASLLKFLILAFSSYKYKKQLIHGNVILVANSSRKKINVYIQQVIRNYFPVYYIFLN